MSLHEACLDGDLEAVVRILQSDKDKVIETDENNWTPLYCAIHGGNLEIVQYLLETHNSEQQLAAIEEDNWTPLHFACLTRHVDTVRYLVEERDLSPEASELTGWTPLHCAAIQGQLDVVKYLLEDVGVDRNPTVDDGNALHLASTTGKVEVVQYLLEEQGYDVHAATPDENTCLHLAGINGQMEVVRYLLEDYPANLEGGGRCNIRFQMLFTKNSKGETPFEAAIHKRMEMDDDYSDQEDVVDLLYSYIAPLAVAGDEDATDTSVRINPLHTDTEQVLAAKIYSLLDQTVVHEAAYYVMGFLCLSDVRM